jgi:hypothetical protein
VLLPKILFFNESVDFHETWYVHHATKAFHLYIYAIIDTNMVIMRMGVMEAAPILVVAMQDSEILCQYHVEEYKVFVKVLLII